MKRLHIRYEHLFLNELSKNIYDNVFWGYALYPLLRVKELSMSTKERKCMLWVSSPGEACPPFRKVEVLI